jgi:hypothetical protein
MAPLVPQEEAWVSPRDPPKGESGGGGVSALHLDLCEALKATGSGNAAGMLPWNIVHMGRARVTPNMRDIWFSGWAPRVKWVMLISGW